MTVENQAVELASTLSQSFQEGQGDGLLGLAFPSINTVRPKPVATPVQNMIDQKDIPSNAALFTAWLGTWKDADSGEDSSWYTFGYIDDDALKSLNKAESDILYTPVSTENGFWQFPSLSTTINGRAVHTPSNTAIADTGTTLALLSDPVVEAVYAAIPNSKYDAQNQGYVFPSNTKAADLPEVKVSVGDNVFTIHKEDLAFADAGDGNVYGGIQSRGDMPLDILGDTFLKGVYAVFDQGGKRFGAIARPEEAAATEVGRGAF